LALAEWAERKNPALGFIETERPMQGDFIEPFNGSFYVACWLYTHFAF